MIKDRFLGKSLLEYMHRSFDTTLNDYCVSRMWPFKKATCTECPCRRGRRELKGQICACEKSPPEIWKGSGLWGRGLKTPNFFRRHMPAGPGHLPPQSSCVPLKIPHFLPFFFFSLMEVEMKTMNFGSTQMYFESLLHHNSVMLGM